MKRILSLCIMCALFLCTYAFAYTINWYVDDQVYHTTTCQSGDNITPPSPPTKYGYTFQRWAPYVMLEYIETTWTQYINTGFIPDQDTRVVMTYIFPSVAPAGAPLGAYGFLFGARKNANGSDSSQTFSAVYSTDGTFRSDYSRLYDITSLTSDFYDQKLTIDQNKETVKLYNEQNEYLVDYVHTKKYFQSEVTMYFPAAHTGNGLTAVAPLKIIDFKIYDNGILVRDYIPVRQISDGAIGMFDKVTQTFYGNAGTGSFIAGPVVGE